MKSLLKVPMPHWAGNRLLFVWCTQCAWQHPIAEADAEFPSRAVEKEVRAAFERHDCASHAEAC
jgi:hypothetical protein